ncbi:hypothetical protein [Rhodococcus gordoniae]|uniref:hypothetical protein n=1 Tax=Rhodococcus gordoniae TaxID=223392 RepID=UPI0007CD8EE9|nr:hypothetical protein [Rhodococcus gordoniae]
MKRPAGSSTAKVVDGRFVFSWYTVSMPEIPAPTIRTSASAGTLPPSSTPVVFARLRPSAGAFGRWFYA